MTTTSLVQHPNSFHLTEPVKLHVSLHARESSHGLWGAAKPALRLHRDVRRRTASHLRVKSSQSTMRKSRPYTLMVAPMRRSAGP